MVFAFVSLSPLLFSHQRKMALFYIKWSKYFFFSSSFFQCKCIHYSHFSFLVLVFKPYQQLTVIAYFFKNSLTFWIYMHSVSLFVFLLIMITYLISSGLKCTLNVFFNYVSKNCRKRLHNPFFPPLMKLHYCAFTNRLCKGSFFRCDIYIWTLINIDIHIICYNYYSFWFWKNVCLLFKLFRVLTRLVKMLYVFFSFLF